MTSNIWTNSYKGSSIELIRAFFAEHAGTLNAQRLVEKKGLSRIRNGKLGSQGSQMARKDLPTPSLSGVTQLNWHKAHKVSVHAGTNITQMRLNSGFSKPKLVRGRALQTLLGPRIPKILNSPGFTRFSAICHIHLFFEEYSNPWIERSLHLLKILPVKDKIYLLPTMGFWQRPVWIPLPSCLHPS